MKVIHFLGDRLGSGGIESFLVNSTKHMNEYGIHPVILTNYKANSIYEKNFKENGVDVIVISNHKKSI